MFKFLSSALVCLVLAVPVFANERTIVVSGTGTVTASPDVAYINLGVVTFDEKVSNAANANKTAMLNVFKVLKDNKIANKDVCTSTYQVTPTYKYNKNEEPKFVGYTVTNELHITVRDISKIGAVLDALMVEGNANRVSSVSFDVLDKEKLLDDARVNAVKDALRKAEMMTKAAGVGLDKVLSISETGFHRPSYSVNRAMLSDSATPVAAGSRQFRVDVSLTISLK